MTSERLVTVAKEQGSFAIFLETAYQASRALLNDRITSQYIDLASEDEGDQSEHPAYANLEPMLAQKTSDLVRSIDDRNVQDAVKAYSSKRTGSFLPTLIAFFYLGRYCDLGPMYPSGTEWCVD